MERTKLLPAYFLARWRVLLAFAAFSGIYAAVYLLSRWSRCCTPGC